MVDVLIVIISPEIPLPFKVGEVASRGDKIVKGETGFGARSPLLSQGFNEDADNLTILSGLARGLGCRGNLTRLNKSKGYTTIPGLIKTDKFCGFLLLCIVIFP